MDITLKDNSGTRTFHGVRSNEASWNGAVIDLASMRVTGLSARLSALEGGSAIVRQGSESVNGYQATRYSIDTASAKSADQKQFQVLFGAGSFEKGTIWMASDGCSAKLTLDEGLAQPNSGVQKSHYEISRSKK